MTANNFPLSFPSGLTVKRARSRAKEAKASGKYKSNTDALNAIAIEETGLPWAKAIDQLYVDYLNPIEKFMTLDNIKKIVNKHTHLSDFGMEQLDFSGMTEHERALSHKHDRNALTTNLKECNKACMFLKHLDKRGSINNESSSYGLKHVAEHYLEALGTLESPYVSNGALICAAHYMGFQVKTFKNNPNVCINFSSRSPVLQWHSIRSKANYDVDAARKLRKLESQLGLPHSESTNWLSDNHLP